MYGVCYNKEFLVDFIIIYHLQTRTARFTNTSLLPYVDTSVTTTA